MKYFVTDQEYWGGHNLSATYRELGWLFNVPLNTPEAKNEYGKMLRFLTFV